MGDENIRNRLSQTKQTKLKEIWTRQNLTLSGSNTGQDTDKVTTLTLYKRKTSAPAGTKKILKLSAVESIDPFTENGSDTDSLTRKGNNSDTDSLTKGNNSDSGLTKLTTKGNNSDTDSLRTKGNNFDSHLTKFKTPTCPNIVVVKRNIEDSHDSSEKQLQKSCSNSNLNMLQCALCTLSSDNPSVYIHHVVSHSNTSIDLKQIPEAVNKRKSFFVCRLCDKKFANQDFARGHISHFLQNPDHAHQQFSNFLTEDKKEFEDFADTFIFPVSIGTLKNITIDSKINKPVIYYCAKCETNFNSKSDLLGHVKNCIKNKSKFNCSKCDIYFETNDHLEQHIQDGHSESKTSQIPELVIIKTENNISTMQ